MLTTRERPDVTKSAARANIMQKIHEARMSGHPKAGVDVSLLDEIRREMENDNITPSEAITRAGEIVERNEGSI